MSCVRSTKDTSFKVKLLNHFTFRNHRVLVFSSLYRSIFAYLKHRPRLTSNQVTRITYKMFYAAQIHRKGIIHWDFKFENMMFTSSEIFLYQVIDLGSACSISHEPFHYIQVSLSTSQKSTRKSQYTININIQSRYYCASKTIMGAPYDSAVDVGVVHVSFLSLWIAILCLREK